VKIGLHSVYREKRPDAPSVMDGLVVCASYARRHDLTPDLGDADAILITEAWRHFDKPFFSAIRRSEVARRFADKTFAYCDADEPIYVMPGLYPSMSRRSRYAHSMRSCPYLQPEARRFERLQIAVEEPDLLFSFSGNARTSRVRRKIMRLRHPRAALNDVGRRASSDGRSSMDSDYWHLINRSKFVLCPRGAGASTFRLFETLCAARVPVVVSDEWQPPSGVNWDSCSVRVSSDRIEAIPQILEELESSFDTMSAAAREAYQRHFATEAIFDYVGDLLETLLSTAPHSPWSPWQLPMVIDESRAVVRRLNRLGRRSTS
jgi:hypothetical protein